MRVMDIDYKLKIIESINGQTEISNICTLLFEEIDKIYPFPYKSIRLKNENKIIYVAASVPDNLKEIEKTIINTEEEISKENSPVFETCFKKQKSIILNQELTDPNFSRKAKIINEDYIMIVIPIKKLRKETIGVIQLIVMQSDYGFKEEIKKIEELAELFYSSFYIYINPFRKVDNVEQELFHKISNTILRVNQLLTSDKVFQNILKEITDIYGFDLSYFLIKEGDMLKIPVGQVSHAKYQYILDEYKEFFNKDENSPSIKEDELPDMGCSYVYKSNMPLYFDDITKIKKLPISDKDQVAIAIINKKHTLRSIAHIPIRDKDGVVGVLELFSFDENVIEITNDDLETLISFCSFIPTAINNSTLYTEIRDKNNVIEEQNQRIFQELKFAKKIQQNIIPVNIPHSKYIKAYSIYKPMDELGGDFFDYIKFHNDNLLGVFLSDVSGHGIPAALITTMIKSIISTIGEDRLNPDRFLKHLNNKIAGLTSGNFITAIYAIIDIVKMKMSFARGAHNYPYIIRDKNLIELNKGKGKMLGVFNDVDFELIEFNLKKGDKIFFYTDGLTEAYDKNSDTYFEPLLLENLIKYSNMKVQKYVSTIYKELVRFNKSEQFDDDICIICLEIE